MSASIPGAGANNPCGLQSCAASRADRIEIVLAHALDEGDAAASAVLAGDRVRGHGRHDAVVAGLELVTGARRAGLDHHRSFEADEHVGDDGVVVPRDRFVRADGHHLDAHAVGLGDDVVASDRVRQVFQRRHGFFQSSMVVPGRVSIAPPGTLVVDFDARHAEA